MKIISFYSDSGGSGKSFLTMWVANILRNKFNKRVVIVDTVAGYENLSSKRKEELSYFENFNILKNDYTEIFQINRFEEFLSFCKEKEYEYDYMFVDVGTINEINMYILMKCNFIFIVTDQDFKLKYKIFNSFKNMIGKHKDFNIEEVRLVFNKVDKKIDEENLIKFCSLNENINFNDFVFPPIYYNKRNYSKFDTLSIGNGKIPVDLMNFTEKILDIINKKK